MNPFPIHEYGARPHQRAQSDGRLRVFNVKEVSVENQSGVTVEHVRDGVAITPKGRILLEEFKRSAS